MAQKMPANQPNSTARTLTAVADSWETLALQEPWSEIIGTVQEVGKAQVMEIIVRQIRSITYMTMPGISFTWDHRRMLRNQTVPAVAFLSRWIYSHERR